MSEIAWLRQLTSQVGPWKTSLSRDVDTKTLLDSKTILF